MVINILLVEDDFLIALALQEALAEAGYQVQGPVSTCREAMALASTAAPDLALVDIRLSEGNSGTVVARALKECCGVHSLFVSAEAGEAQANRQAALGFIKKPYQIGTVLGSINCVEAALRGQVPDRSQIPAGFEWFGSVI